MAEHFAAFSFVDRITEFAPGRGARGTFAVPPGLPAFPACLVAEAVGQLAAWVAMAHVDFRGRPVAALAGQTRFLGNAAPGDTLVLTAQIESCDDEAVSYAGWAEVGGVRVLELSDCFGAMLPVEEFDSPAALRERFELLRGAGAPPGRFHGIAPAAIDVGAGVPGQSATAILRVPASAPYFADHFPRRPVYPATLLLDAQIGMAMELAAQAPHWPAGKTLVPARMTRVKVRAFTLPGQTLELAADLTPPADGHATIAMTARVEGKPVATARLEVAALDDR
ncbi:MAG: hypothetical protein GZ089_08195 [Aromatoleum sp.]|nr:hypothetical protein [Aromatoleum sp.]